ncbi:unnamed protein product [Dibothriocephalus latus]|uniref:Uncharacterized protein n=1 Tax=Dibothriocephalus latus TaxID=60516 RepID=A0A3P6QNS4_DIBLA|nr:unnamed protein product [Dibothriocephalus latus]
MRLLCSPNAACGQVLSPDNPCLFSLNGLSHLGTHPVSPCQPCPSCNQSPPVYRDKASIRRPSWMTAVRRHWELRLARGGHDDAGLTIGRLARPIGDFSLTL